MGFYRKYHKIPMVYKMVAAMVIGILLGAVLGERATAVEPLGKFFLTLLKMIALPLVIVNLIAGISALDDPQSFGRIGGRIFIYYFGTTAVAMLVGTLLATILRPGVNLPLEGTYDGVVGEIPTIFETLIGLVPGNIFQAMVDGRFDQVVVVCALIGIGVLMLPKEPKARLSQSFSDLSMLMSKVVGIIMGLAPFGICALIANSVGRYGSKIFGVLAKYIACVYLGIFCMCMLYATLVFLFTRIGFGRFFKTASSIMITSFSTCSSTSSIPINMECADKLDVPRKVSSFTIPLGAQINKDGTGLTLAIVHADVKSGGNHHGTGSLWHLCTDCQFRGQVRKQDFRRACKIHCLCVPWDILYVYALCHPGIPVHQNRIRPLFQDRFQHHDYLLQHLFQHQFHTNQHGMRG